MLTERNIRIKLLSAEQSYSTIDQTDAPETSKARLRGIITAYEEILEMKLTF